jgi:hypothetical protein
MGPDPPSAWSLWSSLQIRITKEKRWGMTGRIASQPFNQEGMSPLIEQESRRAGEIVDDAKPADIDAENAIKNTIEF